MSEQEKYALVIIDVQAAITTDALYQKDKILENINAMLRAARSGTQTEVIYIRHCSQSGELVKGEKGWQIALEIAPLPTETIFDKSVNSAFRDTGLIDYLRKRQIKNVIICGLQTDFCVDASIKAAFEHHFNVIVARDTTTTEDLGEFKAKQISDYFTELIWNNRYAKVMPLNEVIEMIGGRT